LLEAISSQRFGLAPSGRRQGTGNYSEVLSDRFSGSVSALHPFGWLSRRAQWGAFAVTTALSLAVMVALASGGSVLRTSAAPLGIVSLEFAGDVATAETILAAWDSSARVAAGVNLGLDYLYLFAYSFSIALGCTLVATAGRSSRHALTGVGVALAWLQFPAGGLDAIENYALLQMLSGNVSAAWAATAWWCAAVKFALVGLGLLYSLPGLVLVAIKNAIG
jgi:hypothetical protein